MIVFVILLKTTAPSSKRQVHFKTQFHFHGYAYHLLYSRLNFDRIRCFSNVPFFFSFTTAAFYFAVFFFCLCEFSDRGLPAKTTKKLKPFKTFLAIRKIKKFVKKARNGKRIKSS